MHRNQCFIINMDQTPVFFDMTSGRTLETAGNRTVNGQTGTSSTMRVTVAVTVTANGEMLKPMIIFKGKPGGRIQQREFPSYRNESIYACQDRAWMDEKVLQEWVQKVLKPHAEKAPPGIHPILLLDSYRCHLMSSVIDEISSALGVQVEHIPGGCTGLCQPIDVGIGKPFKNRVRDRWGQWMMEQGVNTAMSHPPSQKTLSEWIIDSLNDIGPTIIRNSWRHGEYSYFPDGGEIAATLPEQNAEGSIDELGTEAVAI